MVRRSKRSDPERLREELVTLLINFKDELKKPEIRKKVISLIPAFHLLRDLGSSLIPEDDANSARDRILYYLKKYPKKIIKGVARNKSIIVFPAHAWMMWLSTRLSTDALDRGGDIGMKNFRKLRKTP